MVPPAKAKILRLTMPSGGAGGFWNKIATVIKTSLKSITEREVLSAVHDLCLHVSDRVFTDTDLVALVQSLI